LQNIEVFTQKLHDLVGVLRKDRLSVALSSLFLLNSRNISLLFKILVPYGWLRSDSQCHSHCVSIVAGKINKTINNI
jgi:hypothetical protein